MSVIKCKMCGGTIEFEQGATVGECQHCGTKQTLPKLDDGLVTNLFNRANNMRLKGEFDKAMSIYEKIVEQDDSESEAHWGIVLCRYGIEYVEDPETKKRIPTCHRTLYDAVTVDPDYQAAIDYSDTLQQIIYEKEAKEIDKIQKGILAIVQEEEPFDVFICYKETDENGKRTKDSVMANDIYHQLTQEGFKVFYAAITLEDKLGQEYEPYIFAALNTAKVMLVIGSKPEYFNAVWVKNEWSRFLNLMKTDRTKLLIPCYKDMDAYELPEQFAYLQAQDMGKIGFINDVIRGIKKIAKVEETNAMVKETVVVGTSNANVAPLLKRAFLFLEDGEWDKADDFCEQVLNQDPENAQAYLGKLMAELHVRFQDDLNNCEQPFNSSNNYQKAVRFGGDKIAGMLSGYINHIIYNNATSAMNSAKSETSYKAVAAMFKTISGFKDADILAEQCLEKAEETKRKILAVICALKKGFNSESNLTLEEKLAVAKARVGYLEHLLSIFDATQSKIQALQSKLDAVLSQEKLLSDQRSKLGIFAGREKKRIDEELEVVLKKKSDFAAQIYQNQKTLGNYSSVAYVERDLKEARNNVNDNEIQIEASRANAVYEYSFEEALNIYLRESDMADAVNNMYPAAVYIPAITRNTDIIFFGRYVQEKKGLPEPIEWQVLTRKKGRMLVISKYALDCQQYKTFYSSVTWENCSMRKWLNETFLNTAFSENERAMIPSVTVSADENPRSSTRPGNSTTDQVFLLSITEAYRYFTSNSARQCQGTTYCYSQGAFKNSNGNCCWWLRSPGGSSYYAASVDGDGSVLFNGDPVEYDKDAVRPVLWIDLGSLSNII